jgi:predicted nucleic acid-binding protein
VPVKLRVYLDTSVFSALHDARLPDRMTATAEFWLRRDGFVTVTSSVTRDELAQVVDAGHRRKLLALLTGFELVPVLDETAELAERYIAAGIFSPRMFLDAVHVAAAVLARCDVLVSWNFRHLVNRRRRAQVSGLNMLNGLPALDIIAPPEL